MKVKTIRKFFIFIFGTMIGIITILFIFKINLQTKIIGNTEHIEKPEINFNNILSGKYQQKYDNYFKDTFPIRTFLIKGMNQILYNFGTLNNIEKGQSNSLYLETWTRRYLMYDLGKKEEPIYKDLQWEIMYEANDEEIDNYLDNIKYIDNYLKSHNKRLIYLITPNKSEVYDEKLPLRFKVINSIMTKDQKSVLRKKLGTYLNKNKILNIDATEIMKNLKKQGIKTFPNTGVHWNKIGSSNTIIEMVKLLRNNGLEVPKVKLSDIKIQKEPAFEGDHDARDLMNVYFATPFDEEYYNIDLIIDKSNRTAKVFAISTSFMISIQNFFVIDMPFKKFKKYDYNQYSLTLSYEKEGEISTNIDNKGFDDNSYIEMLNEYDILLIEHTSAALPKSHLEFVENFVNYLKKIQK